MSTGNSTDEKEAAKGQDEASMETSGTLPLPAATKPEQILDGRDATKEIERAGGDVEMAKSASDTTLDKPLGTPPDPNLVDWDGPSDPTDPMNWSAAKRWGHVAIISSITFVTPLASSMFAPGVPALMQEFQSQNGALAGFVVSVYILGFAVGPLVLAPMSELYGRLIVYNTCNGLFVIFTVACAVSSSLNMLIGFRFLAGCFGAAPLTIGGGTIADLIPQERRGAAMAFYGMGPLLGPVIGPVAGGFLTQAKGWRWVFWLLTIISGVVFLTTLLCMRETYAPVLLRRKASALRRSTNNPALRTRFDRENVSARTLFWRAIIRPTKLLFGSVIVLLLSLYLAIVYGYLYLLFTTFTIVFETQYHFSAGTVGLSFLGIGVGCLVGLGFVGVVSDRLVRAKAAQGRMKPEYRLPPLVYTAVLLPISLFWYGWTVQAHVHWIVPIIGTSLTGFSLIVTWMAIQTYLIDAFTVYAASALAANTVFRSILGATLPLAGQPMYSSLGLGWGNSLLAFIGLALCPIPLFLYRYGERIRARSTLRL